MSARAAQALATASTAERRVIAVLGVVGLLLIIGLLAGGIGPAYLLYLLGLSGMYILLAVGLNVQWGYAGLINFSVAAFFGLGAYGTAMLTASNTPLGVSLSPLVGLLVGILLAAVVALLIAIPTLRLRADYLAIASLGLAEVIRIVIQNQRGLTNGNAGLRGLPLFYGEWPLIGGLVDRLPTVLIHEVTLGPVTLLGLRLGRSVWVGSFNLLIAIGLIAVVYTVVRRLHRSPWGRLLRTIRADEDLARALGKRTYRRKMEAFVLGSVIMAIAGVYYAHLNLFVTPQNLAPINTFYVWVAVILGGAGSNRGAVFGGFMIIAIREGTRFLGDLLPASITVGVDLIDTTYATVAANFAATRLLAVGLLIILVIRLRPEGLLPPEAELIWPAAREDADA
jgi:ABC-type branched-chain amino acid transport system, permease component